MTTSSMATSLNISTNPFTAPLVHGIQNIVFKLPNILFGVMVGVLLIMIITRIVAFVLTLTIPQIGLRSVLVSIVRSFLWFFLAIQVLGALGFSNIIVFFTGSIAAIGIAMAAGGSTLISDIIAGLFLARDVDFNVGDEVIVGDPATQGVIASMDARRVRLRDADGVLHVVPNSVVERREWVVLHRRGELNSLAKAAQRLKQAAIDKASEHKEAATKRQVRLRNNDQ